MPSQACTVGCSNILLYLVSDCFERSAHGDMGDDAMTRSRIKQYGKINVAKSRVLSQCSVFTSPSMLGVMETLLFFSRHATRTYVRPLVETLTKWTTLGQSPWRSDACTTLRATSRLSSKVVSSLPRMGKLDLKLGVP